MRALALLLLLTLPAAGLAGCGDSTTVKNPDKQIAFTPEEIAAIKKEDAKVLDEEGGPSKVTQPTRGKSSQGRR